MAVLALTALLGLVMVKLGPHVAVPALLMLGLGGAAIIYSPRLGLYASVFLTLVGDSQLLPWYPFAKNLSSTESLLYVHDALIFSPLELVLGLTLLSLLGRAALQRRKVVQLGSLWRPTAVFGATLALGFVYGVAQGGNINIALWEVRSIVYLLLLFWLTGSLLTQRKHWQRLLWTILAAVFLEGLIGAYVYLIVTQRQVAYGVSMLEHGAAIQMNLLFIVAAAAWAFRATWTKRVLLLLMTLPVGITYLAAQRRAAIVALVIALLLFTYVLFHLRPRAFWIMAPAGVALGVLYLALFWNHQGVIGMPARAIKSVVAPGQATERDQQSSAYRDLENINILYTLKQAPLTGVGFGQRFYVLVPLPDISFFVWHEYITHNSILWIWMKAGLAGFLALLFMIGWTISSGARTVFRLRDDGDRSLALAAVLYVVMYFVYAYVDMAWDTQSMTCLGAVMGLLSALEGTLGLPDNERL